MIENDPGRKRWWNEEEPKWRLFVMEDTGELLTPDAKDRVGQALSRLLNIADGLLGQGLRTLMLVTTNEPVQRLHEAVARPGRCAAQVQFAPFSSSEAHAWLRTRAAPDVAESLESGSTSLAELFAILRGHRLKQPQPGWLSCPGLGPDLLAETQCGCLSDVRVRLVRARFFRCIHCRDPLCRRADAANRVESHARGLHLSYGA